MVKPGNVRGIIRSVEAKSPREILDLTRGITLPNGIVPFNHSTANLTPGDLFWTNSDALSVINWEQIGRMQSDMAARFAEAANHQASTIVSAPSPELATALMSLASFEPVVFISSAIFEGAVSALKDVWAGELETGQQRQIGIDPNGNTAEVGPSKTPGVKMDADDHAPEIDLRGWNPQGKYRQIMLEIDKLGDYQYYRAREIFEKWNADPHYLQPLHITRLRELCAKNPSLTMLILDYKDYQPHIVEFIRSVDLSEMGTTALEYSHYIDMICRYHAIGNPTALPLYIKAVNDMRGLVLMKTGRYLKEEGDIYYRMIRDAAAADRGVYDQLTEMARDSMAMDPDDPYYKAVLELTLHPSAFRYDYQINKITAYNSGGRRGPYIFPVFLIELIEGILSTVQRPPEVKNLVVSKETPKA